MDQDKSIVGEFQVMAPKSRKRAWLELNQETGRIEEIAVGEWIWKAKDEEEPTLYFRGGSIGIGDDADSLRKLAADLTRLAVAVAEDGKKAD
jgi:hypothetical protein